METKIVRSRGPQAGGAHKEGRAPGPVGPRRDGFTMLELMVAIGVLLVATLAAFASQIRSFELMGASQDTAAMLTDLEVAMEEVITRTADEIPTAFPPGQSIPAFDDLHLPEERIVPEYSGYVVGGPVPDPLEIVLTATWNDRRGRSQSLRLTTIRTR